MESLSSETKGIALDILEDILSAIEKVEERTKDVNSIDDFLCSSSGMVLLDATCMLLIAIGESLKNLDKTTKGLLLPTYPSIPWKNVKGLREIQEYPPRHPQGASTLCIRHCLTYRHRIAGRQQKIV